jgi:hypothetical protein
MDIQKRKSYNPSIIRKEYYMLKTMCWITVFHAARPIDVKSYYHHGLRLGNHKELTDWAKAIFLSGEFPEITGAAFDNALH